MKISMEKPGWAIRELKKRGYTPDTSMDRLQQLWWGWYARDNGYYQQRYVLNAGEQSHERLSLRPASMVAQEVPSLVMTEGTVISSPDDEVNEWIGETLPSFTTSQATFLSTVFALGTGAWVADFSGVEGSVTTSIRHMHAWQIIPLTGAGCAFVSRVTVDGRAYDQLQIRVRSAETGTEVIETMLFDQKGGHTDAITVDSVTPLLDTHQQLPTYTLVTPARANLHDDQTLLGTSIIEDATDVCRLIDETFNQLYWQVRVSLPRIFLDDQAVKRDRKTGDVLFTDTLDHVLYSALETGAESTPITIYNPNTHVDDMVTAINHALGMLGQRVGFGTEYWSFTLHQGLKTATEVVASNSVLMRTIRRHEHALEGSIRRLIQGAYSAECALNGQVLVNVPDVCMTWDDSVMTDDKADRDLMKDDIARGLCPRWRYLTTYYGMSEDEAKAFTGESNTATALAIEIGE